MHFTIEMLPARDGDAFVVSWGKAGPEHRMLIDGGRGGSKLNPALKEWFARNPSARHFDMVVCTHMDADHISGLIGLFNDPPEGFSVGEIWFNAFRHLPTDVLGWKQSDKLEGLVEGWVNATPTVWNKTCVTGKAVSVPDAPEYGSAAGPLPFTSIEGLKITLLSPTVTQLMRVAKEWPASVRAARLETLEDDGDQGDDVEDDILGYDEDKGVAPDELSTRPYTPDRSRANGASIAFVIEFAEKTALFCADAHSEVLEETLRRWQPNGVVRFDVIKMSHHGGEKNTSPEFLDMVQCANWLVSTNGSSHHHPDRRAMARLITRDQETFLIFNYLSEETEEWGRASLQMEYEFSAHLPPKDQPGAVFDVVKGRVVST